MKFVWDANKNEQNISKHGFDFEDGKQIFDSPMMVMLDTRQNYSEDRYLGIGFIGQRVAVVVYTLRETDTIRLISLRKALSHEQFQFEEFIRNQLGAD